MIEINFKGCLRVSHRVMPSMVQREHGRVINFASDSARVGSPLEAVYPGAKGGVVSFTKTLAREVARHGAARDRPRRRCSTRSLKSGDDNANMIDALCRRVPMGRLGQPKDIAGPIASLASNRAAFITGQTPSVNRGLTML